MSTVQNIINAAFFNLGATAEGETPSIAESNDGLTRLNQMLSSWSAEGLMVPNQVMQLFQLTPGVTNYTLGQGGSFATASRAQKVTAWRAASGMMVKGGAPLSMSDFGAAAAAYEQGLAELSIRAALEGVTTSIPSPITAPVPSVLGADTSYPTINIRISPPPSAGAGQIELSFWTPIAKFNSLLDNVSMPEGFEDALHFGLALRLAPQYSRATGIDPALAAMAQQTKAAIVQQNTMSQQQAPPQQQQQQ